MEGICCVPVPQNQANPFCEHVRQKHISYWGSEQDKWVEMSPVKCRSKTASSSLIYGSKKQSNHLQPTLLTKRRETVLRRRLHRCRAPRFHCANHKAAQRQGCTARVHTAIQDSPQWDAHAVFWCVEKEHTSQGQGARSSTFKEPFTPIYFYTGWLKKKKAPTGCSYISLGFYRIWVQHMLFPLPSHSLPSQPPWSKETKKWHTRLVVMWTKKKGGVIWRRREREKQTKIENKNSPG